VVVFCHFILCTAFFYEIAGFSGSGRTEEKKNKGKQLNRRNPRAALAQRAIDAKLSKFSPNGNRHQMEQIFSMSWPCLGLICPVSTEKSRAELRFAAFKI